MDKPILYRARFLLPICAPPIEDGALLVAGNCIRAIGPHRELAAAYPGTDVVDFNDAVLLPPLTNAHTHLELTDFPAWAEMAGETASPATFVDWILRLVRIRRQISAAQLAESLVNGLQSVLLAGTGAIGIEALSRGAARCIFVERDRAALRALEENLDTLDLEDHAKVVRSDAAQAAATLEVDIVFADPPYDFDGWEALLASMRASFVVAESGRRLSDPDGWNVVRSKRYGRTWVTFLERVAQ